MTIYTHSVPAEHRLKRELLRHRVQFAIVTGNHDTMRLFRKYMKLSLRTCSFF